MNDLYFDNSTATRPSLRALSEQTTFLEKRWGSLSAPHAKGEELYPAVEAAIREIYRFIGAGDEDHFVLTSGGAEAVNQVFLSAYWDIALKTGKNQFMAVSTDEAPSLMSVGRLETMGCLGKMLPTDRSGRLSLEALFDAITPRSALFSMSYANGWTGVIQPVKEAAAIAKERGVAVHIEASHVLGREELSFKDMTIDYLTFNGEPLFAPRGSGGVFGKAKAPLSALIVGGIEQSGRRAGNVSVAALTALAVACREAEETRDYFLTEVARLRYLLEEKLLGALDDVEVLFRHTERLPHVTAIAFPGTVSESLLYMLNQRKVMASMGGGISQQLGILLEHSGMASNLAESAISFSLSRETKEKDIDEAVEKIVDAVKLLRKISGNLRRV